MLCWGVKALVLLPLVILGDSWSFFFSCFCSMVFYGFLVFLEHTLPAFRRLVGVF